jgi:hypothetical protein
MPWGVTQVIESETMNSNPTTALPQKSSVWKSRGFVLFWQALEFELRASGFQAGALTV